MSGARRPAGCTDAAPVDLPASFDRVCISADLTFGSATGDYAVVQAWGSGGGGRYLLRQWRKRAGFEEQLAALRTFAASWPQAKIVVEESGERRSRHRDAVEGHPGRVRGGPARQQGAAALEHRADRREGVCFPARQRLRSGSADFVEELAGATKHDDASDAAAYALLALLPVAGPSGAERAYMSAVSHNDASDPMFVAFCKLRRARGAPLSESQRKCLVDVGEPVE